MSFKLNAQTSGDYRSIGSGSWFSTSIWEMYDGTNWILSTNSPPKTVSQHILISSGDSIVISSTDTIFLNTNITVDGILYQLGGLHCKEHRVQGLGTYRMHGNAAILGIGSPKGISIQDTTGNILTDKRFYSEFSTYLYQGNARQELGNGIPNKIKSLVIDNKETFSEASGVRISKNVNISDTLLYKQGKTFANDSTALITMGPNALSKGHGIYSFNAGPIRYSWQVSTSKKHLIPIGKDTLYRPLDITYNHSSSDLNVYQYELINQGPSYTTIAQSAGFSTISDLRYWQCFRIVGSSTINNSVLGFSWGLSDNIENYMALDIGRSNSIRTEWKKAQGNASHTGSNTFGYVFVADNNPSTAFDYILASNTSNNFLLPNHLIKGNVTACHTSNSINYDIHWTVLGEYDVSLYQILFFDAFNNLLLKEFVPSHETNEWEKKYFISIYSTLNFEKIIINEVSSYGLENDLLQLEITPCNSSATQISFENPTQVGAPIRVFNQSQFLFPQFVEIEIYDSKISFKYKTKISFLSLIEDGLPEYLLPNKGIYFLKLTFLTQEISFKLIRN